MCGSLGSASANQAALDVASDHLSEAGHTVVKVELLAEVPAFRPQFVEDPGSVVQALRKTLESCDGVLLAVPEYAGGLAGVVKNALDWLVGSASLCHRPVVVLSAGTTGGGFALEQAIRTLSWQGGLVVDVLSIAAPCTKMDVDGRFVDRETPPALNAGPVNSLRPSVPHRPNGSPWSRKSSLATESTPLDSDTFRRHC